MTRRHPHDIAVLRIVDYTPDGYVGPVALHSGQGFGVLVARPAAAGNPNPRGGAMPRTVTFTFDIGDRVKDRLTGLIGNVTSLILNDDNTNAYYVTTVEGQVVGLNETRLDAAPVPDSPDEAAPVGPGHPPQSS